MPTSILNLVSGDAAKAVYIRSCQVKTCAIGPDLELHNSNYMYSNAQLFIKPTWVPKTGGNVHTQYTCMQEANAHYADIKLQSRKE